MHQTLRRCQVRLFTALLMSLPASLANAQALSVGTLDAVPGQRVSGMLVVPDGVDEGAEIPVTIVNGAKSGPVLALIAGTHGYEYPPILALQRIRRTVDPASLRGALILVHVANPASFFGRTIYYNPVDGKNLNRAFPGKADGTHSERIARVLTAEVIEQADFVVDLHAGDGNEALRPFTYMPETGVADLDRGARRLAIAFGLDHIVIDRGPLREPDDSLYVDQTALTRGVPGITTETGQLGSVDERWVAMAERGIHNLMLELGMVDGEKPIARSVVWLEDYEVVTSPGTGLFRAETRDGYVVAAGASLGTLVDVFGDEIAVIRAPFAGVVNYVIGTPPVTEGEPLAMISRIADQDRAPNSHRGSGPDSPNEESR